MNFYVILKVSFLHVNELLHINAFYAPNTGCIETKTSSYVDSLSNFILKLILKIKYPLTLT